MSRSLNKVMLIGNVGKDPDVRYTAKGDPVATFSLATSRVWRDKDGNPQEKTEWHNIVAWGKLAEIIQDLVKKGTRMYIEGKIQSRDFVTREGEKRYITEIVADNMLMLDSKEVRDRNSRSIEADTHFVSEDILPPDDDLPF